MTFKPVSVNSLMLYFEQVISEEVLDEVQAMNMALKDIEGIIDLIPSYCSILVEFDIFMHDHKSLEEKISQKLVGLASANKKPTKLIKIPTDYSKNLDLERVASHNNLSIEEVINIHTKTTYRVYTIGFMVGFAYLASVNSKISTPRLASPRKKVPKGSVALADLQTAIYPQDSAGGWNIIGHTEFNDFHSFEVGDKVQFERI
ncbi:MAG: Allophanate hydrolase 2 subunit 1 (EC [uncultured Sulfurovum sp.]|uniref:Allophanate hydrolase 2 subunit 1 (EC) n=1 Tax=uncultured Sulfurovum sp. TaxID=269237 RepID=A0A6S6TIT8_9BACT|nr:MAG: Allophanate hydrolase 2 subunit 1 (EC [uncultured Sulfurovum sp.]